MCPLQASITRSSFFHIRTASNWRLSRKRKGKNFENRVIFSGLPNKKIFVNLFFYDRLIFFRSWERKCMSVLTPLPQRLRYTFDLQGLQCSSSSVLMRWSDGYILRILDKVSNIRWILNTKNRPKFLSNKDKAATLKKINIKYMETLTSSPQVRRFQYFVHILLNNSKKVNVPFVHPKRTRLRWQGTGNVWCSAW